MTGLASSATRWRREALELTLIIEGEVGGIEKKVGELTEDLQRVHAEYANYRKRIERDREINRQWQWARCLQNSCQILDDLNGLANTTNYGAFKTVGEKLEAL